MRSLSIIILLVVAGIAIGYAASRFSITNAATVMPGIPYKATKDISYNSGSRHRLDIYAPEKLNGKAPVIVYFYGGAWQMGSKEGNEFIGQRFAAQGFITVIADYRIYPGAYFPDFLNDAAAAVKWTHDHIGEYGGDASHIFVAGHSAGAYNAVMVATDAHYLTDIGGSSSWIKGVIGLAGLYDYRTFFSPSDRKMFAQGDESAKFPDSFTAAMKSGKVPPMLLLSGDSDHVVSVENTRHLAALLTANHSPVEMHIYPRRDHMAMIEELIIKTPRPEILQDIVHFVHQYDSK